MAMRMFADQELEELRRFPEIGRDELFRFFTLTPADIAFIDPDPGRWRGPADRLGLAVNLCTLPWLGFVPDEVADAPRAAVARLAEQLGLDPDQIRGYGGQREHQLRANWPNWVPVPASARHPVLKGFRARRCIRFHGAAQPSSYSRHASWRNRNGAAAFEPMSTKVVVAAAVRVPSECSSTRSA